MVNTDPVHPDWDVILPIASVPLTDGQWKEIVRASGLPDAARSYIGRAVMSYRLAGRAISPTPSETRRALAKLQKQALALHTKLEKLLQDYPLAVVVLSLALGPQQDFPDAMSKRAANVRLSISLSELQSLAKWLGAAQLGIAKGKTGAAAQSKRIQFLVSALDYILERFTGRGFSRTKTLQYVKTVCQIADPGIGAGSIGEAMRGQIAARARIARNSKR